MTEERDERDLVLDELEREIVVLVRRARRVVAARAALVHPELQPAAYLLLAMLRERGSIRASEVVDAHGLDKGVVSRQVQHVVELGLVERTVDPADRRAHLLALTEAGRARMAEVEVLRRERLRARIEGWDDAALAGFVTSMRRYNALFAEELA
ncbi:MarR family winged helix-turn-helix transcriptional regulator [Nocardioides daphniae]|uniref:MarR family transcriptional regulator n=1 Tax=Nocardioides daphniae TaxID=402297 RepID=A0A4V1CWR0_9ACTN|nr:MarR family transcriptional regulator [Nocardioides daphniae]QCC78137.1 MarR family transcriptional regulator [Nocardioides daphniae]GGD21563.1 hypothetical protein GCM10007231_20990 [Nocardioides daphniae]